MAATEIADSMLFEKRNTKKLFNWAAYSVMGAVLVFSPFAGKAMFTYNELHKAHTFMQTEGREFIKSIVHACRRADVPILVCDEQMQILHSNSLASEDTGYERDALRKLYVIDLVPDECLERHRDGVGKLDGMVVSRDHEIPGSIKTTTGVLEVRFQIEYLVVKDIRFYIITWAKVEE